MRIEAGDDVFVDDDENLVGYVRRANLREVVVFVEDWGDFTLPRELIKTAVSNGIVLPCQKLPLRMRAAIGHLHGLEYVED
ncbi:hypothetical protein [Rhizomicrobium electricum]|jgi:hypothetical protein|uniref:Uncharacterized protein n=1 Tax=Rhizomicrobium electricum TaxID=480070 RepID=A0ABP3PTH0_9PROT|nr:hypothetical protein [Rhizomicrobium electricum]NIJ49572.1 hypothetical protein [Rhizomicrobium electricum]